MARLDAFIDILLRDSADELVLEAGGGATLVKQGAAARPLLKQALSAAQLLSAVKEVLPEAQRGRAPAPGTTFGYASPAGPVQVRCERGASGLRVVVTPHLDEAHIVEAAEEELRGTLFGTVEEHLAAPEEHAPYDTPPHGTRVPAGTPAAAATLDGLLAAAVAQGASDLHLACGAPPLLRIHGSLQPLDGHPPLSAAALEELIWPALPETARAGYDRSRSVTCTVQRGAVRFRATVFAESRGLSAALRPIAAEPLRAEKLGLPAQALDQCFASNGLILVTGAAGSGRSTTLASLVDFINRHRDDQVLTLEEPVELLHRNQRCLVRQREVPGDVPCFEAGLRQALHADADVVVAGDLRDAAAAALAIELAAGGRLVIAQLSSTGAIGAREALDRLLEQAPAQRSALAESLRCVISQTLCRRLAGGRVAAFETLLPTPAALSLLREGGGFQLPLGLQPGRAHGLSPMNDALAALVEKRVIDPREAVRRSPERATLKDMLERKGFALQDKAS